MLWCVAGAVAGASACTKPDAAPSTGGGATTAVVGPSSTGDWPAALGALLVVPSDTEDQAVVLFPVGSEPAPFSGARLALLGPSGDTVRAWAGVSASDSLHCGDAPVVRLTRAAAPVWSLGIESRQAIPVRSDSMEQISAADSAFYAAEMARLASAVASGQTSRFTGLVFTLTALRRTRVAGREVVAAQLVRRVNQEADPAEEHTLVVAERDAGRPRAAFAATHTDRSEGSEDSAEHYDVIATMRVSGATLFIVSRDQPSGTTFEILERTEAGVWHLRWTRTIAC